MFQLRTNKLPKTIDTDNIGNIESVENENVVSTSINFDSQDIGAYINLREKNIILPWTKNTMDLVTTLLTQPTHSQYCTLVSRSTIFSRKIPSLFHYYLSF